MKCLQMRKVLSGLLIASFMLLQILMVYFSVEDKAKADTKVYASACLERMVTRLENMYIAARNTSINLSFDEDVKAAFEKDVLTSRDVIAIRRKLSRYINSYQYFKNIYLYDRKTGQIYGDAANYTSVEEFKYAKTASYLRGSYNAKTALFVDKLPEGSFGASQSVFRHILFLDDGNAIVTDLLWAQFLEVFAEFNQTLHGGLQAENRNGALYETSLDAKTESFSLQTSSEMLDLQITAQIPASARVNSSTDPTRLLVTMNLSAFFGLLFLTLLFVYIRKNYLSYMQYQKRLQEQSDKKLQQEFAQKKEKIIHCVNGVDDEYIRAAREYLEERYSRSDGIAIIKLKVLNYTALEKNNRYKNILLYKFGMINICEEILKRAFSAEAIFEDGASILFLIVGADEAYVKTLEPLMEEAQGALYDYVGAQTCFFASDIGSLETAHSLFKQANDLEKYLFLEPARALLHSGFAHSLKTENVKEEIIKQFASRLVLEDAHQPEGQVAEFFSQLRSYAPDAAKGAAIRLLFQLSVYAQSLKESENLNCGIDFSAAFGRLLRLDNLGACEREILELAKKMCARRGGVSQKKSAVHKCEKIIEQEFGDVNLCLDTLAERLSLSKIYLGRIFKKEVGSSVADAINATRLRNAARLLLETDRAVKDIAASVGFVNDAYFSVIFKKFYGATPTAYRFLHRSEL